MADWNGVIVRVRPRHSSSGPASSAGDAGERRNRLFDGFGAWYFPEQLEGGQRDLGRTLEAESMTRRKTRAPMNDPPVARLRSQKRRGDYRRIDNALKVPPFTLGERRQETCGLDR